MAIATSAQAAAKPAQTASEVASQADSPFAIADFDGDQQLDIATVQVGQVGASDTRYWIHFRLSSGLRQLIPLTAPLGGLRIASQDVNGDSFIDLIVTTAWHELPVAVLLNDGRGNFTVRDPHGFPAAMAARQTGAASALVTSGDIAAALVSRNSSSRCENVQRATSHPQRSGFFRASLSQHRSLGLVESVLGRAPPVPFIHV